MLIGIVSASNIRYSPYIYYYTGILDSCNIDYELIYANREGVEDTFLKRVHPIKWNSKIPRAIEYFKFSRKVQEIIKDKRYDGLIMLTAQTATYCSFFLLKYYKKKYIVDIRDYSHENLKTYYALEKLAINNSATTVVSSPKFKSFLPMFDYMICHNINFKLDNKRRLWRKPNPNRIVIGYIGILGYKDNCISLINLVNKDSRFELRFYGFEPGKLVVQKYIEDLDNKRIVYYGAYKPTDKEKIINSVDIMFNTYGKGCPLLDTALSNKLYDALYYKKLLLTSPHTAMEEVGGDISYSIDYNIVDSLDGLYEWVMKLDNKKIQKYQDDRFNEFVIENNVTKEKIIKLVMSWDE